MKYNKLGRYSFKELHITKQGKNDQNLHITGSVTLNRHSNYIKSLSLYVIVKRIKQRQPLDFCLKI